MIDAGKFLVKIIYKIEGDGPLARFNEQYFNRVQMLMLF